MKTQVIFIECAPRTLDQISVICKVQYYGPPAHGTRTVLYSRMLCRVRRPRPGQSSERGAILYHVSDLVPRCGLGIPIRDSYRSHFLTPVAFLRTAPRASEGILL